MSNTKLIDALNRVLADSYSLYLKNQNYHWNVEGPHFGPLHALFEEHYTDLAAAIDEIAEVIRMLGQKVDGTFDFMMKHRTIADADSSLSADAMLKDLIKSQDQMMESISEALEIADDEDDDVAEDLCVQRLVAHRKQKWMLESTAK